MNDGTELFGPGNTWESLYAHVHRYMNKRFYFRPEEIRSDAASEGFDYIASKWVTYPSSLTNDLGRNWNYAKRIARKQAAYWLGKQYTRPEVSVSTLVPPAMDPEQASDRVDSIYGEASVDVYGDIETRDLRERARAALIELAADPDEFDLWVRDFIAGMSLRDTEAKTGTPRQTLSRHRMSGLTRARPVLIKHGLIQEDQ